MICTEKFVVEQEPNVTQTRWQDGSAGDIDYAAAGKQYAVFRQEEPIIAAQIRAALGDANTLINVGAGAGSYEPTDMDVVAVEPSATMRSQRPAHRVSAIDAVAENLPFADKSFDSALASVTVHQWRDLELGIAELKRVTRGPIVLMVADPALLHDFWMTHYVPEALDREKIRFPAIDLLTDLLGPTTRVESVPIPFLCKDGFTEAYYGRPEMFLNPDVTGAMSSWTLLDEAIREGGRQKLARDLADGTWDANYGHLREQPFYDGSLRLIVRP